MNTPCGVYPDDCVDGAFAPDNQKTKRLSEIICWLYAFRDFCLSEGNLTVVIDDDAAEIINEDYWDQMGGSVRARLIQHESLPVRADRHKIASLLELLVCHHQPFYHDDADTRADLNARAAFFVATNIIGNWGYVESNDLYVSESFDREHRTWLRQLDKHSEGMPIFSNAATWYLVEKIFMERKTPQLAC